MLKADSPNITNTWWDKAELLALALSQRNGGKDGVYWELEVWFKANLSMQGDLTRISKNHHKSRIGENSKMRILRWRIQTMLGCKLSIDAFHLKSWWFCWQSPMINNQTICLNMTVLEKESNTKKDIGIAVILVQPVRWGLGYQCPHWVWGRHSYSQRKCGHISILYMRKLRLRKIKWFFNVTHLISFGERTSPEIYILFYFIHSALALLCCSSCSLAQVLVDIDELLQQKEVSNGF